MSPRNKIWSATSLAVFMLSGCHSTPEGQVAAKVNGREISIQELNAELDDVPPDTDRIAFRKRILPQVIDRELFAEAARKMGLDKTPDFLAQRERQEQKLLVQLLAQKLAAALPPPDGKAIDRYLAEHPFEFANRQKFYVDQLRFPAPQDVSSLMALGTLKTLDQIADALTQQGVQYVRENVLIDSAYLDPGIASQLAKQPLSDPILFPYGSLYVANAILNRVAAPVSGTPARGLTAEILRRQAIANALGKLLQKQRKEAKIEFQPGFQPDAKSSKTTKAIDDATGHSAPSAPSPHPSASGAPGGQ